MCVIAIVRDNRPSDAIVRAMWDTNAAGGGFAWRDKVGKGTKEKTLVHWNKGIDTVEEMIQASKDLPLPYVLHFRIPTCGGTLKALTHPFGIDENASIDLEGTTERGVLFHNGHFNKWREAVREYAIATGARIPGGAWSDSRAMAWLTYHLGDGMVEFFEEKLVLFTPYSIQVGNSGSFSREDGILYSNLSWKHRVRSMFLTAPASMAGAPRENKDKEDHSSPQGSGSGNNGNACGVAMGPVKEKAGSTDRSSGTNGGRLVQSPFVRPSPLKHRNPETGELISKKALKRWKKLQEARASRGDSEAKGWLNWIEKFPWSTRNPEYYTMAQQAEMQEQITTLLQH